MTYEINIKNFQEHIQRPLEKADPRSFEQIKRSFYETFTSKRNPFSVLIKKLTGKTMSDDQALILWRRILENKTEMEKKLLRRVGIQTAALDYIETQGVDKRTTPPPTYHSTEKKEEQWFEKLYSPGYHVEKLKEEVLRSKRYKHALSAIMLDVDEFHRVNETFSYEEGDKILGIIVKIITKTIRNVDILARYSGDRFLLILPNTNRREAMELAERLRERVNERTQRIQGLPDGLTLTLSVGQCRNDSTSTEFMKQLEHSLIEGKRKGRNAVYMLE
ncbi:GGDEF domain-containing protein [Chitinispirillales bacterium ANBcel5]|uniref:GGDEF domain-containing protein n=1 Tax=Cellulosispirillum alkaliphilum TaxID=3039283 RepID=UPI002A58F28C|nr:GGDEF domain-containing protein [Chitinispirillales bacterium ANBcel5]